MSRKEKYGWATCVAFIFTIFQGWRCGILDDFRDKVYTTTFDWWLTVSLVIVFLYLLAKWGDTSN